MMLVVTIQILLALHAAMAMELWGPRELRTVEGAPVLLLPCDFRSVAPISPLLRVVWQRRDSPKHPAQPVLLLEGPSDWRSAGLLRGRARWAGRVTEGNAALELLAPQPSDSGLYSCDVLNLPDVDGVPTRTQLVVLARAPTPRPANGTRPESDSPTPPAHTTVESERGERAWGTVSCPGPGAMQFVLVGAGLLVGVALLVTAAALVKRSRRKATRSRFEEPEEHGDGSTVTLVTS
ncbi:myelin protein zero-like protein 2 [Petromyzon marinus]|nr:myelin protein zero-like protein 2 isoform X2 [Petromyzon marinus]XP_032833082.1 myelin protein zero-like protein 2 isoform X3 [Petromyzon marinus]XP_032833083.1 myelin protein zero-like protein 2 isoform X3 [Petromyzon marinus]